MSKRQDQNDLSAHPPIATKRRRLAPGFRAAHNRDSEPQNTTLSSSSTQSPAKPQQLRPGFRAARSQEHENSVTNSRITTLTLGANGRLIGRHKIRSHNPSVSNPTPISKLLEWLSFRDATLDEILRHDGLGDFLGNQLCMGCNEETGLFKCKDCSSGCHLRCQACVVKAHSETPLHRIEKWTGGFFDKTSLKELGLRVQLGHGGGICPCSPHGPPNFMVFDTSGVHVVNIDYCDCPKDNVPDRKTQLLRQGWFPATFSRPNTAFTFDCLDTFHEHTLQGKGNLYDFYHLLVRKTDNANLSKTFYRYKEIHRVFRIWRNLMALKRAGRGHDLAGVDNTLPGSLTVECPACPHPGRNLPQNWQEAGPLMFLYILYISVDGNFKLKGKDRGLKDVELMPGWGPFVEESAYQAFIADYVDQPEINTCESEHDAIVRAQTRCTPGYAVSGTVIVICSRHALIRRNGAGDLQKGEKYCNVDFIIFAALVGVMLPWIFITYDIGCQWSTNLQSRMSEFPEHMKLPSDTKVTVAIPSWHINSHGRRCRKEFCLGHTKGAGRTRGEEVETTWSSTNSLAQSVREMAPGARHDTLNDQWNGWNFRKIVGFRTLFVKRFKEAILMSEKQKEIFNKFSSTFPPETVVKWEQMVIRWEADPKAPNPYDEPEAMTTLQDVRLTLTRKETLELVSGRKPKHKVTLMGYFSMGFDIEDQQFILKAEMSRLKGKKTSKQLADLEERKSTLIRHIQIWRPVQLAYTPHVVTLLPSLHTVDDAGIHYANPESTTLFFPSSLPPEMHRLPELKEVCDAERSLREPQAHDALADIRCLRRIIQGLWQFKKLNVSGTGNHPNTRMLGTYSRIEYKLQRAANRYRVAYTVLLALDPDGAWKERLKELKPADLRGPGKDPNNVEDGKTSNSQFTPSWIWLVPRPPHEKGDNQTEDEFNDSMRAEWAQTRARMSRWGEEVLILQEEMRRVLAFFEWKATWWLQQGIRRQGLESSVHSGIVAYALKQAAICSRMAARCAAYWLPVMERYGITPTWAERYKDEPGAPLNGDPSSSDSDSEHEVDVGDDKSDVGEPNVDDIFDLD
ncbi:uncharacterized protein LACBIDRAFT_299636 [Laccaria bicolor S238N-H82]|uniref:Predicted protein n=1 Tax=Laccaria bicolor (strain S238N-H82 / ATCC MYA-4686) TaxID=486041 RepID=B0DF19_LACBS|nr:uncharacterized protein LACBIDRAFT_299636 [Laccaria bicolor S238N-H82]EDR06772.1 predicted protein [Laccaria bicolor S238N-H82]|eukprot:XP_001882619.1 predicted protein [Laccaria bicolor S238N-H82]